MYEKQLVGRCPLYFRYAPPITRLDDYSDDELPNPPFKGAEPFQRSVYYYWWLFLKEHDGYRACCDAGGKGEYAELYEDFGDVRGDDFMAWWKRGGRLLFCVPQDEPVHVYPSREFNLTDGNRVVMSLPVDRDVNEVLAEIRALLKPLRKQVPLRENGKRAKYEVAAKPVLTSLHQHWQVYRLRKQNPYMKLHEIGDEIGILVDEKNFADPVQVKAVTVSRYYKQATTLIEYVGRGLFPITREVQIANLKKW